MRVFLTAIGIGFLISVTSAVADPEPINITGEISNGISNINLTKLNQKYKNSNEITNITFHHEGYAGPNRKVFEKRRIKREIASTLQRVENIHGTATNGGHLQKFGMVAYHYIVGRNGEVVKGRPIKYKPGTHSPYDFSGHFAVVALGDFDHEELKGRQRKSYVKVMSQAQRLYGVSTDKILPHRHYHNGNLCPGKNIFSQRKLLVRRVMIHSIQAELSKRDCNEIGQIDGIAGAKTIRAFRKFTNKNSDTFKNRGITNAALMEMLRDPSLKCS